MISSVRILESQKIERDGKMNKKMEMKMNVRYICKTPMSFSFVFVFKELTE